MSDNSSNGLTARFISYTEFRLGDDIYGRGEGDMSIMPIDTPPIIDRPIIGRPPIGGRPDRTELSEMFEQPTGWMDRLVDAFGIDDTRTYQANGKTVIDTGMGSDEVEVKANKDGTVSVTVNGEVVKTLSAEEAKNLEIRTGSGDDTVKIDNNVKAGITVRGGSGNDNITGGGGNDRIFGGSGNDTVHGGRGNDYIHGGSGDDKIQGGRGHDQIFGGSGSDEIRGGRGNDTIHGGAGSDKLHGDRGRDNITRDWQDSDVNGGKGNDKIVRDDNDPFRRPFDYYFRGNFRA